MPRWGETAARISVVLLQNTGDVLKHMHTVSFGGRWLSAVGSWRCAWHGLQNQKKHQIPWDDCPDTRNHGRPRKFPYPCPLP